MNQILSQLKDHISAHYESGGWDVVAECWSDAELLEEMQRHDLNSLEKCIKHFGEIAEAQDEQRRSQLNEIF